jgi:hypothetical protein
MELPGDLRLRIFTYTAEPGSKSEKALNPLGSWAASLRGPEVVQEVDQA